MKCEICGEDFQQITHKHLAKHEITVEEYKKKYGERSTIDPDYFNRLSKARKGINAGDKNGSKHPEIRKKISNSLAALWEEGAYDKRINGMQGLTGDRHHGWIAYKHTLEYQAREKWKEFLDNFQDTNTCSRCNKTGLIINVHHVDEDHENFLPSNLEPLCVPCHMSFHYGSRRQPYTTIGKRFKFVAAHKLPKHKGKCKRWHGHSFSCAIWIRKRIDPDTDMVMDFGDLKDILEQHVISKLDHGVLNDYIQNPTAERIAIWVWNQLMFGGLLKGITKVIIKESDTSIAKVTVNDRLSAFSAAV